MKNILVLLCLSVVFSMLSCKETNKEASDNAEQEVMADTAADRADVAMVAEYQCPMDCEEGKVYEEEGTCPVCKMELKQV